MFEIFGVVLRPVPLCLNKIAAVASCDKIVAIIISIAASGSHVVDDHLMCGY